MVVLLVMETGTSRLSPPLRTGFAQIDTICSRGVEPLVERRAGEVTGGRIVAIDALADPARLERLDLTILDD